MVSQAPKRSHSFKSGRLRLYPTRPRVNDGLDEGCQRDGEKHPCQPPDTTKDQDRRDDRNRMQVICFRKNHRNQTFPSKICRIR